jgi:hypothetical protein
MEVIRIPQVSLVDATGRRIGVYTDDPDWWQQLKLKHHNTKMSHAQVNLQTATAALVGSVAAGNAPPRQAEQGHAVVVSGATEIPPVRQMTPINNINTDSSTNLRSRLIREGTNNEDHRENMQIAVIGAGGPKNNSLLPAVAAVAAASDEHQKQCNVIGETPLHIAIMYDDLHTIKFLIEEKGFDVNQRSSGGRFTSGFNSKMTTNMIQQSKYEGLAYYGEYPLAFAACFASKEIYDYLVEQGADPNLQGTISRLYYRVVN